MLRALWLVCAASLTPSFGMPVLPVPMVAGFSGQTKETDRKRAQKIADQYEGVSGIGRMGLLTERQARKVVGEIFQIANRQVLAHETIGDYLTRWLASKKNRIGHKSFVRYSQLIEAFLKWIGPRASFGLTI
jgi:hypothetical protein